MLRYLIQQIKHKLNVMILIPLNQFCFLLRYSMDVIFVGDFIKTGLYGGCYNNFIRDELANMEILKDIVFNRLHFIKKTNGGKNHRFDDTTARCAAPLMKLRKALQFCYSV